MIKWIAIILTSLGMVISGVYFLEDRYFKTSEAQELKYTIEKDSVKTFQQQQDYIDLQQNKLELELLDILKDNLRDIERQMEENPNSIYLKNQHERLKTKIKRMENKLYE